MLNQMKTDFNILRRYSGSLNNFSQLRPSSALTGGMWLLVIMTLTLVNDTLAEEKNRPPQNNYHIETKEEAYRKAGYLEASRAFIKSLADKNYTSAIKHLHPLVATQASKMSPEQLARVFSRHLLKPEGKIVFYGGRGLTMPEGPLPERAKVEGDELNALRKSVGYNYNILTFMVETIPDEVHTVPWCLRTDYWVWVDNQGWRVIPEELTLEISHRSIYDTIDFFSLENPDMVPRPLRSLSDTDKNTTK